MRRLLIVAALLASVVTPAVRASAQTTGAVDAITWQSAGDSFSSGTGTPGAAGPCQHSTDAYGPVAARIVRDSGWQISSETFTACHGHLVEDFFNRRQGPRNGSLWDWGREQGGPERVDVLTMSFGGNDIGFAHVMRDCAQVPDSWLDVTLGATGCDVSEDELKARIDALLDPPRDCTGTRVEQTDSYDCDLDIGSRRGSIIDFYYDIAQDRLTERGHLYVIGYPQMFAPIDEWRWYQKAYCAAVSRGDTEKLASVALHLDYKLQEAVDRANEVLGDRIKYLNLRRLYRAGQHELCGSNDDWLNGIVIDGISVELEGFPSVSVDSEASFHPNAGGHQHTADLLARRVLQDLNNRPPPPTTTTTVATLVTAVPASATVPLPPPTTTTTAPPTPPIGSTGESDTDTESVAPEDAESDPTTPGAFTAITAGNWHSCGLRTDGTAQCWGNNHLGRADAPSGVFSAITAGGGHSCGLRTDGTAQCWGDNNSGPGQADAPSGVFTAITAGLVYSCGLRTDGTAQCWGYNASGQADAPPGVFTAITAGLVHSCGLRTDGTAQCWGYNAFGESDAPSGVFTAITAGGSHSCGLRTDGTAQCWGYNASGQVDAPSGVFTAITAGGGHSCGLRTDGTAQCWGNNNSGQTDTPPGAFTAITAGVRRSCGLRTDGTAQCWGSNDFGESDAP